MSKRRKRTPWDRIIRAANKGHGVRLSAEDCGRLGFDGAIETRAELDATCFDAGHDPETCNRDECEAL